MHRSFFAAILGLAICGVQARADGVAPPVGGLLRQTPCSCTGRRAGRGVTLPAISTFFREQLP
jgi:hypothetical protein